VAILVSLIWFKLRLLLNVICYSTSVLKLGKWTKNTWEQTELSAVINIPRNLSQYSLLGKVDKEYPLHHPSSIFCIPVTSSPTLSGTSFDSPSFASYDDGGLGLLSTYWLDNRKVLLL
jgi:hypothetical protein